MLMNSQTPIIDLNHLVRRYGRTDAVDGLSLRVQPGRCYGFLGRNGAGKTTTIKCLLSLLQPTSGSLRLFGLDTAHTRSRSEVAPRLGAGCRRLLSVDDRARHARLFRVVPRE